MNSSNHRFRLGPWRIDPGELTLTDGRRRVHLQARTMRLLVALHRSSGRVVSKDALSAQVWGEEGATDELIARHVSMIRRALGDSARQPRYLETVPRRGYRLVQPPEAPERRGLYWISAAAVALAALLIGWLVHDPAGREALPARTLASARPLLGPGPFRADLASSPARNQIAFIEGRNIDLVGDVVLHDLEIGVSTRLAAGLNRYPAFSADGSRLAFFRDAGGCRLIVLELPEARIRHQSPCGGKVSSPPAWQSERSLLFALDGGGKEPSRLMAQELGHPEPEILWDAPAGERIRFPLRIGPHHYALIRAGLADRLVRLNPDGSAGEVLYGDDRTRVAWLAGEAGAERALLVKFDQVDRFALYELGLTDGSVRLIGNRDAVQSAAYAPGAAGVYYASTEYRLHHRAYLLGPDRIYRHVPIQVGEPTVPYTELAPAAQVVVYPFNTGNGSELYRLAIPDGPRRRLLAAKPETHYGFPAWFADGSRIAVATLDREGGAVLVIDADSGDLLARHRLDFAPGPLRPGPDGRTLMTVRPSLGRLGVHALDLESGRVRELFETEGQWGQFSADAKHLYVVDAQFRLIAIPLAGGGAERDVVTHVGSATGWRVVSGILFYACPGEPTPAAMLCEMDLQRRAVLPHPEVTFYPSRLSVSDDRSALTVPRLSELRMELMSAPWARADRFSPRPRD